MFVTLPNKTRGWVDPEDTDLVRASQAAIDYAEWRSVSQGAMIVSGVVGFALLLGAVIAQGASQGTTAARPWWTGALIALSVLGISSAGSLVSRTLYDKKFKVVDDRLKNGRVVPLTGDTYRLLNDTLYRRYRLYLDSLLCEGQPYTPRMLEYIKTAWPEQQRLNDATLRRDQLAHHNALVQLSDQAATNLATLYMQEVSVE